MSLKLPPCPSSPNCVSSEDGTDEAHRVEPLPAGPSLESTRQALRVAIAASGSNVRVVSDEPAYLRATFRSRLLGFTDDVELRIDGAAGLVQVRSASRVGTYDFGVNRARVERLREAYAEALLNT